MTYRYIVLYFLNLSLKHFFPTENGNFCENIQIRRPLSFRVLTCRACPIDVLPNRRQKTLYIVSASVCSIKGRHIHPVRYAKHAKQILQTKHTFTTKLRGRPFDSAGDGGSLAVYVESEYLFPIFCGRQYLFSSNFSTDHLF